MGALSVLYIFGFLVYWLSNVPCETMATTFPAYFIFGDSLVDVGNNNYILSLARANNLPFGIDFPEGPTGRFCNGKTVPDILCEMLSLPFPPPYLAPTTRGQALLQGVNYASGAGGILASSGSDFVGRVDMDMQLSWYGNTVQELQEQMGEAATQELLAGALFSTTIGANDYINNYLLKISLPALLDTPAQFQQRLLSRFASQLTHLYNMGARNIFVFSIGPIGCIPSQLAIRSVDGECSDFVNNLAIGFNKGLKPMLSVLNSQLIGSNFMYVDVFQPIFAYRSNPQQYGFQFGANACCGGGRFNGELLCLPTIQPCANRSNYVFWDAYHPTERTNFLLANIVKSLL